MNSTNNTSRRLTCILYSTKGVLMGVLTLGFLAFVVFVVLHYAQVPAGGTTTWIILGVLAVVAIARGMYVTKSEIRRLDNYNNLPMVDTDSH